jgi:hypothetical protein
VAQHGIRQEDDSAAKKYCRCGVDADLRGLRKAKRAQAMSDRQTESEEDTARTRKHPAKAAAASRIGMSPGIDEGEKIQRGIRHEGEEQHPQPFFSEVYEAGDSMGREGVLRQRDRSERQPHGDYHGAEVLASAYRYQ